MLILTKLQSFLFRQLYEHQSYFIKQIGTPNPKHYLDYCVVITLRNHKDLRAKYLL